MSIQYYNSTNHRGKDGYQNMEVAMAFVDKVFEDLTPYVAQGKDIYLIGVDNSTTFLSAILKTKLPNAFFVSGDKNKVLKIQSSLACVKRLSDNALIVFLDDFYSTGNSIKSVVNAFKHVENFTLSNSNFFAYYIASSEYAGYIGNTHDATVKVYRVEDY